MLINDKILNLPPYLSTSWENVTSIHMKGALLVVVLKEGEVVHIPGLGSTVIETIFSAHAKFLEMDSSSLKKIDNVEIPFRFGFATADSMAQAMQHNPAQANTPDIPDEILSKISAMTKIIAPEDSNILPKAEPHCNCMHCQIARAIHRGQDKEEITFIAKDAEEEVLDEELSFQQWEITQTGDKLYAVINRLDSQEKYSVYLGHPIGCTCGTENCEHIVAVLKT